MYKQILNYLNEDKMTEKFKYLNTTELRELQIELDREIALRKLKNISPLLEVMKIDDLKEADKLKAGESINIPTEYTEANEALKGAIRSAANLPLDFCTGISVEVNNQKHVILMDLSLLPEKYKADHQGFEKYQEDFNVKLIPYDSTRQNTNGAVNTLIQYLGRE